MNISLFKFHYCIFLIILIICTLLLIYGCNNENLDMILYGFLSLICVCLYGWNFIYYTVEEEDNDLQSILISEQSTEN